MKSHHPYIKHMFQMFFKCILVYIFSVSMSWNKIAVQLNRDLKGLQVHLILGSWVDMVMLCRRVQLSDFLAPSLCKWFPWLFHQWLSLCIVDLIKLQHFRRVRIYRSLLLCIHPDLGLFHSFVNCGLIPLKLEGNQVLWKKHCTKPRF